MMSRVTLRKSLKWFALLLVVGGLSAGGYAYWLWTRCDEILLNLLIQKQQELAPEWDVRIGRAHFDWHRRVHVHDVKIKAKGQTETILTLPEVIIEIDREQFERAQRVEIETVHLLRPRADLVRDAVGVWNWQALLTLPRSERSLPEWTIEEGTCKIRLEQPAEIPATSITLGSSRLQLVPSGKRQFTFEGNADFNEAAQIDLQGHWDLDAHQWTVRGRLQDLTHNAELLQLAAGASAEVRRKFVELGAALERTRVALMLPEAVRVAARPDVQIPLHQPPSDQPTPYQLPDFGIESTLDLEFQVTQTAPEREWRYQMLIHLKQGTISHPVLPFPLRDLAGQVVLDNQHVEFRHLTAKNGVTKISLKGQLQKHPPHHAGQLQVELTNLLLDDRLRSRLPESLRQQFDTIQPSGPTDVTLTLHRGATPHWEPRNLVITAKGCTSINKHFPYPATDIVGTLRQQGDNLVVDLLGRAGGRPVEIRGEIKHPGPEAETAFVVRVRQFPLDERFLQACTPESQAILRRTRLTGWADAYVSLHRPAGPGQRFHTKIGLRLANCEVLLDSFPYRVTNLTGIVTYRSDEKFWTFQQLRGEHGTATLTAHGEFRQRTAPGVLDLTITTQGATLDESLYRALPPALKTVWSNFSPTGKLDTVAKVLWVPNGSFEWSLPKAVIYEAGITLKAFPYVFNQVRAELSYVGDRCEIKSFSGRHDETRVRGRGIATLPAQGRWQLDLLDLFVDDLSPDRQFRQALPGGLRTVFEELDPQKAFSFSGGIRFSGTHRERDPIGASWNLDFVLTGNQLNTGIQLKNVHGQVSARGTWDGERIDNAGQIQLESVEVLDYQLTKVEGPYLVDGQRVVIGSANVLDPAEQANRAVPFPERLTAQIISGTLTYDAEILLEDEVRYRSRLTLVNGRLEDYARRYLPGTRDISGVMNGWLDVAGRGVETRRMTGSGQLRISPAALYELPIMAQILQVISLGQPDRTAFRFAFLEFDLANNQFIFKDINLVGEPISLRGQGTAGFDSRLNLDFYSMLPRARLPWPVANLVNPVLDQATKDWVRVEVRGKTSNPDVRTKPVPVLDDALKRFLGILGTSLPGDALAPPRPRFGRSN